MRSVTERRSEPVHSGLLVRLNGDDPGLSCGLRWRLRCRVSGPVEGGEVLGVGVGKGVQVLLGGGYLRMTHAVHHALQVRAAGEEPGRMCVAQVVDPYVEVDARGGDGGSPDPGAGRCCARGERGVPSRVANSRSPDLSPRSVM